MGVTKRDGPVWGGGGICHLSGITDPDQKEDRSLITKKQARGAKAG